MTRAGLVHPLEVVPHHPTVIPTMIDGLDPRALDQHGFIFANRELRQLASRSATYHLPRRRPRLASGLDVQLRQLAETWNNIAR